jgi:hypothetical protein
MTGAEYAPVPWPHSTARPQADGQIVGEDRHLSHIHWFRRVHRDPFWVRKLQEDTKVEEGF